MSGLTLKGTPPRVIVRVTDPEHQTDQSLARLSEDERVAAILECLADGPRFKWQIREHLHEPESVILRTLRAMKRAKQVKVVGPTLDRRAWALASACPTVVASFGKKAFAPAVRPKPAPPATSWWLDQDRDGFCAKLRERWRGRA